MDLAIAYQKQISDQYEKAKEAVSRGKLEAGRVERAYALLRSETFGAKIREYSTTMRSCGCPDYYNRTGFCKHRLAFIMNHRAIQNLMQLLEEGKIHALLDD